MNVNLAVPLAFLLILAGCTTSTGTSTTTVPASKAPEPTADAATGSISGLVVDDEQQPIVGAEVGLNTDVQTRSDDAGRFTFNDLQPGTVTVNAARLGFSSSGKRVEVRAGEVTELTIVLLGIEIQNETFVLTIPKVHHIVFGNAWTNFATQQANASVTHELTCNACVVVIHFTPKTTEVMTEALWPCGCQPYVNQDVWIKYLKDWETGATLDGTVLINTYLSNREQFTWTKALSGDKTEKALKGEDRILFQFHAGNYVNYESRVSTWHSFLYSAEEFPENFTAMPPV